MSKFIRTFLIGIAPLALLALGAQVHAQATDVDCFQCIDTRDIASKAVTSSKIRKKAVTTNKLAPQSVTSGKIKDGAVTVRKVSPKLSNSLGQFCLPDETVVGMEADGNFACELPQTLASDVFANTRAGTGALSVNTGQFNTAFGLESLLSNTTGADNTAVGAGALSSNTIGLKNTGVGRVALTSSISGSENTAVGYFALESNETGSFNTAVGRSALRFNTGGQNTAIGHLAGRNLTTGGNNIAIGHPGVAGDSFTSRIGNFQDRTFIAGIRNVTTGIQNGLTVVIDGAGQLGTVSSSRRYKEQIHDMEAASGRLLSLRPVTFRYKQAFEGGDKPIQFGLIAEEVAEVFPELVVYNEDGAPEAVKYRLLSTLLLNEVQKQSTEIQALTKRLERLENAKPGAVGSIQ